MRHDVDSQLEIVKFSLGILAETNELSKEPAGPLTSRPKFSFFTIKDLKGNPYCCVEVDHDFLEDHDTPFISKFMSGQKFKTKFENAQDKTIIIGAHCELSFSEFIDYY